MIEVSAEQVLAWRLHRQYVEPLTDTGPVEIVGRLCGVQAQVASAAETAVALRQRNPQPEGVKRAYSDRSLVKTWAMRGTLHAMRSSDVAEYLSLLAGARTWTKPSWSRHFGATPEEVEQLTESVADLLHGQVLSRDELVSELVQDKRFKGMEEQLRSGWGALLKPLAWQGALCYGPSPSSKATFTHPASLLKNWNGLPDPAEAAPAVIMRYLSAYGPATPETFDAWLSRNSNKKSTLRSWFASLGEQIVEVRVEGETRYLLAEHEDELAATRPSRATHLLGAFDQFVLGPGTKDTHMLAHEHRRLVSKAAGWIAPVLTQGGRITGVWEMDDGNLVVTPFPGEQAPPSQVLEDAAARLTAVHGSVKVTPRVD